MRKWAQNRVALLSVLAISIAVVGLDWLIASNDDSWSDTELVLFNLIAVVGIATILGSLGLLAASYRRSVSR